MTAITDFTLHGKVRPQNANVTPRKVMALKGLIEEAMSGDRKAKGIIEEAISTSDAMFNWTHLVNLNLVPQFEAAPRQWTKLASVKLVSDFRDVLEYELDPQWDSNTLGDGDPLFTSPEVPEGTEYPEATFSGQAAQGSGIKKYGFGSGFTFEAFVNDSLGVIATLPEKMLQVALDTEEKLVFGALKDQAGATQQLQAGNNPDKTAVPKNAPFTRDALIQALIQVKQRKHNKRFITFNGGFKLVVAPGAAINANWQLYGMTLDSVSDSAGRKYSAADAQLVAGVTEVIESPFVSGNAWYLVPNPGSLGAGRDVLKLHKLIGHETPELRVENVTGNYVGGGTVSPFEGSFSTDTSRFRIRQFGSGFNWFPNAVIWSTGAGS